MNKRSEDRENNFKVNEKKRKMWEVMIHGVLV